jgi:histidinol-phosphate aminotransferase
MSPNIVFVASPNNPTGNRMTEARVRALLDASKDAFVVLDEAYVDYTDAGSLRALRAKYPRLGVLRTLSKVGLAALRVGWLEADASLVAEIDKARQPFNLSATSQAAASAVLARAWDDVRAHVARVVSERGRVAREIAALDGRFEVTPSEANFLWVKTPGQAGDVYEALASRGVLVRSFHATGGRMASQLRVTIGRADENDRLLEALRSCAA